MALSQIQCLDDHHVNWRVSESKAEFFYSEDQRVAVEQLISKGPDAFMGYISDTGVRNFLSEPELERIIQRAELYRPGHEHQRPETPGPGNLTPGSGEDGGDGNVSLQYWPDRSEASVAELDLGWPEAISYRGVTRVTVHTQPPVEGNTHIKEVVRKSIAAAQKVIAVVMDVFTDVDIFRDLLDAAYRRRVPVYIIIDMAAVPCFLSMCGRNLRVRCCGGVEFFTRSAQKVRGSLSQKFLLVDGDRAISGSYSFTWSSSRLDRNLITVVTGQAVETFDLQFRDLYLVSRAPLAPVSAAVARKLINPKYALVTTGAHVSPSSSDQNSSNKNSQNPTGLKITKGRLRHVIEEPPIHPGLACLEKAYLIPYLPTWPEPDPPSDVIGFINIRDEKRAHQVHLQRSERFETSQAIRFSSPLMLPENTEEPAGHQHERTAKAPAERTDASSPLSPTKTQPKPQTHTDQKDQTDTTDSKGAPREPNTPLAQEAHEPETHTPTPPTSVTADSQPTERFQTPPAQTPRPPVPKPRTLQLIIDSASSEQLGKSLVMLTKMDQLESEEDFRDEGMQRGLTRRHMLSKDNGRDSGSNEGGSQDSTKVICDRSANDEPSSTSTASEEEFYDCPQEDPLTNGVTTGSGRGHRQGDGVNMMARLSQSMLDLREPSKSEDSTALIRQSQQLRRQIHSSPHRHIGQVSSASVAPFRFINT
uniref:Family with sequence similarity 83 member G n=1 Tax=Takifugu rubripes TaxID=31033 RepID=A0A3B5KNM1_TAKRU